uniref:alpha/beta fold hydrolase n=1 Tax=Halomonas sp. TaxID=1486246 RepID=UPI00260F8D30|nr:alpha/beta fold hydrolase [Halomonas sp.]
MSVVDQPPEAITLADGRIAGLAWGRRDAPTWLALHGWLDNAASFTLLAPMLVQRLDIRIVAIDFSGHGESAWLPGKYDYALWDYCHDVLDVLDELGIERATLLAHSMGAGVSCLVASAMPERIERMTLIDGLGALTTPAEETPQQLARSLRVHRRLRTGSPRYADLESAVAARVAGGVTKVDADTVRPIVARNLVVLEEGGMQLRTDPRLVRPSPVHLTSEQVTAMLGAIECRVTLIEAAEGSILGESESGKARRAAVQHLTRHVLAGGHHLHASPAHVQAVAETIVGAHGSI